MGNLPRSLNELLRQRQHARILRLAFPHDDAPPSELLVNQLDAIEGLSRDFEFVVELLSDDALIDPKAMQGKLLAIELVRHDGTLRHFTGYVFGFRLVRTDGGFAFYEARLGPWLKYLALRKDCFIFHNATLYEQTTSIFRDYLAHPEWEFRRQREDPRMTDACQFNESDYNYLSRRWEAAGWHYHYEHTARGHTLVLGDDSTAAAPVDGVEIAFQRDAGAHEDNAIGEWSAGRRIVSASTALCSFNFKSPRPVHVELPTINRQGDVLHKEVYEYAGGYGFRDQQDGERRATLRMEEIEHAGELFEGSGNNRNVAPGRWFRLTGHFQGSSSDDQEFLITDVRHSASNNYHVSDAAAPHYENRIGCIRRNVAWRPGRGFNSVEPKMVGLQTAIVVGPPGEEIHTDQYGRVKVQFHWDRAGEHDERSSAWLRVATAWAGANFGMTAIPRIGSEVIVQFLDGNPDRGIVTGMVPNTHNMPPWELPANKTQSGLLSRSTPDGGYGNANALRFEDKKGQEQLWLHAERDQLTEVEHDEDKWVGNDRRKTVDRDETSHIGRDRSETVGHDETISVHHNRSEQVGNDETIAVGANRSERVGANETVAIGANQSLTVGQNKTETVTVAKALTVGAGYAVTVGGAMNTAVGLAQFEEVGLHKTTIVGNTYSITAGDELNIKVGQAHLVMKSDGTVLINGVRFDFAASGPVQISGRDVDVN